MAMVATTHLIAARRTNPPASPRVTIRSRATSWVLRHSRWASKVLFERLRQSLPILDPDRHALEAPATEDLFAHLAIDHPEAVTQADGGQSAREADHETLLLALCDLEFRGAHGPQHSWPSQTLARYSKLLDSVSTASRAWSGGGAS